MKRRIVSILLVLAMFVGVTAYAAPTNEAVYNKDGNSVSVGESGFNTILIRKQGSADVVYVNQNDGGFEAAQEFLIKDNPSDGTYDVMMGKTDGEMKEQSFTITTEYLISGSVDANVKSVLIKKYDDSVLTNITEFGEDFSFTFNAPNGTYTISAEVNDGYTIDEIKIGDEVVADSTITVNGAAVSGLNITTKEKLFTVKGTIATPKFITSVKFVNGSKEYQGTFDTTSEESTEVTFANVPMGTYNIEVNYTSGYESDNSSQMAVVDANGKLSVSVTISAKLTTYKVSGKAGNYITSVALKNGDEKVQTVNVINGGYEFTGIAPGTYMLTAETSDEEYYITPFEVTVNADAAVEKTVTITQKVEAIQSKYTIKGTIDSYITKVNLLPKNGGTPYEFAIDDTDHTSISVQVPKGEYSVAATYDTAARKLKQGSTTEISVTKDKDNSVMVTLETEAQTAPTYSVTGSVSAGVASVILKDINGAVKGSKTIGASETTVTFTGLEAGTYTVTATYASGYEEDSITQKEITVTNQNIENAFTVTAKLKKYSISGMAGEHITAVKLLKDGAEVGNPYTVTAEDRTFTFEGLEPGEYILRAVTESEYESTDVAVEITDADIAEKNLTASLKKYSVTVTVDNADHIVTVKFMSNGVAVETINRDNFVNNSCTAELPAGEYSVVVDTEGGWDVDESNSTKQIRVTDGSVVVEITTVQHQIIPATYTVSGTVDEGVASITVKQDNETVTTIDSFENNQFSFVVEEGTYTIQAEPNEGYEIDSIKLNNVVLENSAITVTNADVLGLHITAKAMPTTYKISGTVGNYITSVTLKEDENDEGTTVSVVNGAYEFEEVVPGTYIITAKTNDEEYYVTPIRVEVTNEDKMLEKINAIQKLYTIGGTISENIIAVTLVPKNGSESYSFTINDTSISVRVPKGTYIVRADYPETHKLTADSTTEIEVTADNNSAVTLETELQTAPTYKLTGNVGEGVAAVILTDAKGTATVKTVSESATIVTFTGLEAGTYTVTATYTDGYEKDSIVPETIEITSSDISEAFTVTAKLKKYSISGTAGEHITAVKLLNEASEIVDECVVESGEFSFDNLLSGKYTIRAVTDNKYESNDVDVEIITENISGIQLTAKKIGEGTEITSTTKIDSTTTKGKLILTTTVSDAACEGYVIIAAYGESGLIMVKISEIESGMATTEFEDNNSIKSFRTFVWESLESMKPITKQVETQQK